MQRKSSHLPQYDYALALQRAVSWLGDRYLLAQPVSRRVEERQAFFVETHSWREPRRRQPATRAGQAPVRRR
jgi:hypothetical protein